MRLSARERAAARHLVGGYNWLNISAILSISGQSARNYINRILKKSGTRSSCEFAMKALRSEAMLMEIMEVDA